MKIKQKLSGMECFHKANRFVSEYGYGMDSAYIHADPVVRETPAVQVWFELNVEDFERARLFLDQLAVAVARAGEEGLVRRTGRAG